MTPTTRELTQALKAWDGASAKAITDVYDMHHRMAGFTGALIAAAADPQSEAAATWLIKHHCEETGAALTAAQCNRLFRGLATYESWAARLHVLQCVDHLPIPTEAAEAVMRAVTAGASSSRALIRAWSLYAAARLAVQHAAYRAEAAALLRQAEQSHPTGAVAVRLREARVLLPIE